MTDQAERVRNNLTDVRIKNALADKILGGPYAESNAEFYALLEAELAWRDANNKHYTEREKMLDVAIHHEKILRQRQTNHDAGYIPPDYYWWQDDADEYRRLGQAAAGQCGAGT